MKMVTTGNEEGKRMKKIFNSIVVFAALISAASCHNEIDPAPDFQGETHTVSFVAGTPDTKTTVANVDGVAVYSWESSDLDNLNVFEDGNKGTINKESCTVEPGNLVLNVTFPGAAGVSHRYTANLNGAVSNTQTSNGKYDASSDVLVAYPVETTASESAPVSFNFKRVSTISKITVKGLTNGEIITEVILSSDKQLAGTYTPDVDPAVDGTWSENTDPIVITCNETVANGQVIVYAVTRPVTEAQLTVTAETRQGKRFQKSSPAGAATLVAGNVKGMSFTATQIASKALPYVDDFDWQTASTENTYTDEELPSCWIDMKKAAPGKAAGVIKVGSGSDNGWFETKYLDLSSAFHLVVSAKAHSAKDGSKIKVTVGSSEYLSEDAITDDSNFGEYVINCNAATACSSVTLGTDQKRMLFDKVEIKPGNIALPARILISNDDLTLSVPSAGNTGTIAAELRHAENKELHVYSDAEHTDEMTSGWFTASWNSNGHDIDWTASANTSTTDDRTAYLVVVAKNSEDVPVTAEIVVSQPKKSSAALKTYSLTINPSDFSTSGYDANAGEKTFTANATDGTSATMEVKIQVANVMQQSSKIQFRKNSSTYGRLYNTTDLGTITGITFNGWTGTAITKYINSAQQPTSNGQGGFFYIRGDNSNTYTFTSIVINFEIGPRLSAPTNVQITPSAAERKFTVSWTDAADATGYNVYNGETKLNSTEIAAGTQSFDVENITFGTEYSISVEAVADGYKAARSASSTITVNQIKLATPSVNTPSADAEAKTISVSWAAVENATSYTIYNDGASVASNVSATSYTFEDITYGQQYSIQVEAHSSNANILTSDKSAAKNVTVADPSAKQFEVSPLSFTGISAAGDNTKTVTITADEDVQWEFGNVSTGLTFTSTSDNVEAEVGVVVGSGSATVTIIVPANTGAARTLTFNVIATTTGVAQSSYTVSVTQAAGKEPDPVTKTETFEDQDSDTTYNGQKTYEASESNAGISWFVEHGTVSTTNFITGTKSMHMRAYYAKNSNSTTWNGNLPYLESKTPLKGLKSVSFNAAIGTNNTLKYDTYYSTNGKDWTQVDSNQSLSTTSAKKSFDIPNSDKATEYYFKIAVSSSSTHANSPKSAGNITFRVDDIEVTYYE